MRVALKFAYDGTRFSGYARQPEQVTVEGELLRWLLSSDIIHDVKESCFRTASRTDRGVSALGNVCAFNTTVSLQETLQTLSKHASDIFVYGIQQVAPEFYPRHAKRREYRYYLRRNDLDVDAVLSAAALFTGEHDFSNFARIEPRKDPVRIIDNIIIQEKKDFFVIDFYAQTFLWNQIRRIVSGLEKVGAGKLSDKDIKAALDHPEMKVDYQVAAPEPLILKNVLYDFEFNYGKDPTKSLQIFENKIVSCL